MFNKLAIVASILIVLTTAHAANLDFYRKTIPALREANAGGDTSAKRILEIRKKLVGTNLQPMQGLDFSSGAFNSNPPHERDNRYYSSFLFKDFLDNGLRQLLMEDRFGKPIVYNPSWTNEQHKAVLESHRLQVCMTGILNQVKKEGAYKSEDEAIIGLTNRIVNYLVNPERERSKAKPDPAMNPPPSAFKPEQLRIINSHLARGPMNQLLSIKEALGNVTNVEFVNGLVQRIIFSKGAQNMPGSLTMFVNFRAGEDQYFIEAQDCLIEYLKTSKPLENKADQDLRQIAIDYLVEKSKMAKSSYQVMSRLSRAQINYIIDMFLQLRGNDLLSRSEAAVFGTAVQDYESTMNNSKDQDSTKKLEQVRIDYTYYFGVHKQLNLLERTLEYENKSSELIQRDIQLMQTE